MNIAVCVKQVPDTYSERTLAAPDWRLDRAAADAVIDEIDSRGVELALTLAEAHGGEVTVVTMGPDRALEAIRKALAMGAHKAVHITDAGLAGSDASATAAILAAALRTVDAEVVICGNEASDGKGGVIAAMLAEHLGRPLVTQAKSVSVDGTELSAQKVIDGGTAAVQASLPVVVSVSEKINEPRYPNFKGIMAAKSKPVTVLCAAELAAQMPSARTVVVDAAPKPPHQAGVLVTDDGSGAEKLADFLLAQRLI